MKTILNLALAVTAISFVCGCGKEAPEKAFPKSAPEGVKPRAKLIAEPADAAAEPVAVAPTESAEAARPKAQRRKMTEEERKALREKRREEFYRRVDAERNKTHEQRVQEHEEAMQRAQAKRDLQEERLKRILEKRAKQQAGEQGR